MLRGTVISKQRLLLEEDSALVEECLGVGAERECEGGLEGQA